MKSMAAVCPQCGASVKDDSRFCNYCGTKLVEDPKITIERHEVEVRSVDETKIRMAEIKKEKEQERITAEAEAQAKLMESQLKMMKQQDKSIKWLFIFAGFIILIFFIMSLVAKSKGP